MTKLFFTLLLLAVLLASGLLFYVDYGPVSSIPILQYRHLGETEEKTPDYVHPRNFVDQMKFLADDKFNVISLDRVLEIYRNKEKIPQHTVAITFDGGYSDFYDFALSVLEKYRFPATVFLQSSNLGKRGFMTKEQVLAVYNKGLIAFGSNGQTGQDLSRVGAADAYTEIFSSRSSLLRDLEIPIEYFSYPNGAVNAYMIAKVRESGYKGACALLPGKKHSGTNPYVLKRHAITPAEDNVIFFKLKTWGEYARIEEWRQARRNRRR